MTSIFITLYSFPQDQFWPPCHWESEEIATDCVLLQEIFTNVGSREPTRCPITYRPKSLSLVEAKVLDRWVVKFIARWGTIKKPVARWGITYFRISQHWVKKSVTISGETGGTILDRWVKKLSVGWDKTWGKLFDRGVEMLVVRLRKFFLFWIKSYLKRAGKVINTCFKDFFLWYNCILWHLLIHKFKLQFMNVIIIIVSIQVKVAFMVYQH